MKVLFALASFVAFSAAPAFAGEGQVSSQSLNKMGLSGMKSMTDAQGLKIRGLSIAVVGGFSTAHQYGDGGSASSTNFYFAAGHYSASGNNVSFAAAAEVEGRSFEINAVIAGGASSAHAH
jgi:hypothetical protein